jgi:hypothetical protein
MARNLALRPEQSGRVYKIPGNNLDTVACT